MEVSRQRDVADYEKLRSEALLIGLGQGSVLLPCGLAAWLTALWSTPPGGGSCMTRALRPTI
jgi:hypothetical protein